MLGGSLDQKEKAHRLLNQIVNNLTSKMEIGYESLNANLRLVLLTGVSK